MPEHPSLEKRYSLKESFLLFEILDMLLFRPQFEAVSLHLEGVAEVMLSDTSGSVYDSGLLSCLIFYVFFLFHMILNESSF